MLRKSTRNVVLLALVTATVAVGLTRAAPVAGQDDADAQAKIESTMSAAPPAISDNATIDVLSVSKLNVPEAHPLRTTARLTVPPRAQWQTVMADESLILSLETGSLRVGLQDGRARIARATDAILGGRTLDEMAPGEEATMWAGDRLIIHGNGALVVHALGEMTAIATIVRVTTPR